MTKIRYFGSINGNPVRLENVVEINGVKMGLTPDNIRIPADRKVAYKSSPSRHRCDDRCVHATGRTMKCECACGGLNHGKGAGMAIMF